MSFPLSPIPSCLSHYHKAYNYITIFHCSRHVLKNVIQLLLLAGHEIINIDNNLNNLRWHLDSVICTFDKIKVNAVMVGGSCALSAGRWTASHALCMLEPQRNPHNPFSHMSSAFSAHFYIRTWGWFGGFRTVGLQKAGYDIGYKFTRGGKSVVFVWPQTARRRNKQNSPLHNAINCCCCSDASYIPLHPQHLHRSMKDWSMSKRQIEETTKKKGVANDGDTGERVYFFSFPSHITNTGTNVVDFCF